MTYAQILNPEFKSLPAEQRSEIFGSIFTETRAKVLETVLEQCRGGKFRDLSLRDIAEATGLSLGNISYHFPTRAALVEALCAYVSAADSFRWPASPARDFEELNGTIVQAVRHYKLAFGLNLNSVEAAARSKLCADFLERGLAEGEEFLSSTLDAMVVEGLIRSDCSPLELTVLGHTLLIEVYFSNHYWRLRRSRGEVFRRPGVAFWSLLRPYCTEDGANACRKLTERWTAGNFDKDILTPEPKVLFPAKRAKRAKPPAG